MVISDSLGPLVIPNHPCLSCYNDSTLSLWFLANTKDDSPVPLRFNLLTLFSSKSFTKSNLLPKNHHMITYEKTMSVHYHCRKATWKLMPDGHRLTAPFSHLRNNDPPINSLCQSSCKPNSKLPIDDFRDPNTSFSGFHQFLGNKRLTARSSILLSSLLLVKRSFMGS